MPIGFRRPAFNRHRPIRSLPHRNEAGHCISDVSVNVGIDEILRGRRELSNRTNKLLPARRTRERIEGARRSALEHDVPLQGQHRFRQGVLLGGITCVHFAPPVGILHRSMARRSDLEDHRRVATTDANLVPPHVQRHPFLADAIFLS